MTATAPVAPATPVTPEPVATPAPAAADWRSNLPVELRDHPTFADTKSVESLARQHLELNSLIGRKGIIPPANDSPEEMNRYYKELGRPDKPDGYSFKSVDRAASKPERLAFLEKLRPVFHEAGASDEQADRITRNYLSLVESEQAQAAEANATRATETVAVLQKKWGLAYEANRALAERAGKMVFGEQTLKRFAQAVLPDGSRIGDHPEFIENLYKNLGTKVSEDGFTNGSQAAGVLTPEAAQLEINRLNADSVFLTAYYTNSHREHQAAVDKMKGLYAMANPEPGRF